jgi:hypothetical protein
VRTVRSMAPPAVAEGLKTLFTLFSLYSRFNCGN